MDLAEVKGTVDFGIITIREDEFNAVLDRFPRYGRVVGSRGYNLCRVELDGGGYYIVAVIRCIEQGNGEAQAAARDLIEDLNPPWLLVVGIAGGVPADEFTLGDVVVSTRIYDFSVEAVLQDRPTEFTVTGGLVDKAAATLAADLPALKEELGAWNSTANLRTARRPIAIEDASLYGDEAWRERVKKSLLRHAARQTPLVTAGAIASSDRLVKDTELITPWLKVARHIWAVEMESAGVYRAVYGRPISFLSIRGISDIIGLKRDPGWTSYACHTAAAVAYALLKTKPLLPKAKAMPVPPVGARPARSDVASRGLSSVFDADLGMVARGRRLFEIDAQSAGILLVEDDETLGGVLLGHLDNYGYPVLLARNVDEALELLQRFGHALQIAVIDLSLADRNGPNVPFKGGLGLATRVREMHQHMLVIGMSNYASVDQIKLIGPWLTAYIDKRDLLSLGVPVPLLQMLDDLTHGAPTVPS